MKRMKRLSFQWRITLLTAILIAGTCKSAIEIVVPDFVAYL